MSSREEDIMQLPHRWRGRQHQRVALIGTPSAESAEARAVIAALAAGHTTFGDVARSVADQLIAHDLAGVGPLADIGLFRSWYLCGACRLLERLEGTVIAITDRADTPSRATAAVRG
jgi:hypothetical protein